MPSLTPEEQERLGRQPYKCSRCGQPPYKNYCRSCDEFYTLCGCPKDSPERPYGNNHDGHRVY